MSTAATNQSAPATAIPISGATLADGIPPAVQAELTALRTELAATKDRLAWLEKSLPVSPMVRMLMPPDSQELKLALELAKEVFLVPQASTHVGSLPATTRRIPVVDLLT